MIQQQTDDRKHFGETICMERRAAEERFTILLQAMQQTGHSSNSTKPNQVTPIAKTGPTPYDKHHRYRAPRPWQNSRAGINHGTIMH